MNHAYYREDWGQDKHDWAYISRTAQKGLVKNKNTIMQQVSYDSPGRLTKDIWNNLYWNTQD